MAEANKTRRQTLDEGRARQTSNAASEAADALVAEARAYFSATDYPEAPQALASTPTAGVRLLVTYGGPTIELVLEQERGDYGRGETTGRVEYMENDREVVVHSLNEDEARDLWSAYRVDSLIAEPAE